MIAKLEQSALFDRAWYLETYPDVRDSGIDPVRHYFESGWREGRDPGPNFCTTAYLKANSDVAALGANPLLHYVEHGKAEGRGAPHQAGPLRATLDPLAKFGPAASCVQFPVPDMEAIAWARAGRVSGQDTVEVSGVTICRTKRRSQRVLLEDALRRLAWISGTCEAISIEARAHAGTSLEILDAWYAGEGILRTRWRVGSLKPVVVRALQHVGKQPELVGETCIGSDLDVLDLKLANPLFPLLFLFTEPDGEMLGVRHLTFPSLCRGNLHYPELVAAAQREKVRGCINLASIDELLAAQLIALRQSKADPLLAEITVDVEGADGAHPLFQPSFQTWLARVIDIQVRPSAQGGDAGTKYLAGAIPVEASALRSGALATLRLAGDMIPTITVLSSVGQAGSILEELAGSVIAQAQDSSPICTFVQVPPGISAADFGASRGALPTLSPRAGRVGLSPQVPLAAIRLPPRRRLSGAELLFPGLASQGVPAAHTASISWLIWPPDWSEQHLLQSLQAVFEQSSCVSSIIFVGQPTANTRAVADRLFELRVTIAQDAEAASAIIETSLCGYLAPSVILHDRHTIERLATLLDGQDVLSATAISVFAERRGKGTLVSPADRGSTGDARLLPGAVVPISGTPVEFWISRADLVKDWLRSATGQSAGRHLCTTLVAVTNLSPAAATEPPFILPAAANQCSISTELLVG
jgi:hypothetical protein